jgi:hypothetical protein
MRASRESVASRAEAAPRAAQLAVLSGGLELLLCGNHGVDRAVLEGKTDSETLRCRQNVG